MENNSSEIEPLVSVCVVTYNHEAFIRESLDSILNQKTSFKIEVLINDDASTDNTAEILKEYERQFPDIIKPLYQKVNQRSIFGSGMNPRFNYPRVKGRYVAILDGDDFWMNEEKLQKQFDFLEKNEGYSGCFHNTLRSTGRLHHDENFYGEYTLEDMFSNWIVPSGALMFRSRLLDSQSLDFLKDQKQGDYSLSFYLLRQLPFFAFKDVDSYYRKHDGGVSNQLKNGAVIISLSHDMARMKKIQGGIDELVMMRLHQLIKRDFSDRIVNEMPVQKLLNRVSVIEMVKEIFRRIFYRIKIK